MVSTIACHLNHHHQHHHSSLKEKERNAEEEEAAATAAGALISERSNSKQMATMRLCNTDNNNSSLMTSNLNNQNHNNNNTNSSSSSSIHLQHQNQQQQHHNHHLLQNHHQAHLYQHQQQFEPIATSIQQQVVQSSSTSRASALQPQLVQQQQQQHRQTTLATPQTSVLSSQSQSQSAGAAGARHLTSQPHLSQRQHSLLELSASNDLLDANTNNISLRDSLDTPSFQQQVNNQHSTQPILSTSHQQEQQQQQQQQQQQLQHDEDDEYSLGNDIGQQYAELGEDDPDVQLITQEASTTRLGSTFQNGFGSGNDMATLLCDAEQQMQQVHMASSKRSFAPYALEQPADSLMQLSSGANGGDLISLSLAASNDEQQLAANGLATSVDSAGTALRSLDDTDLISATHSQLNYFTAPIRASSSSSITTAPQGLSVSGMPIYSSNSLASRQPQQHLIALQRQLSQSPDHHRLFQQSPYAHHNSTAHLSSRLQIATTSQQRQQQQQQLTSGGGGAVAAASGTRIGTQTISMVSAPVPQPILQPLMTTTTTTANATTTTQANSIQEQQQQQQQIIVVAQNSTNEMR